MADTDKPPGLSVVPPTVPIRNVNVPDPTIRTEPESNDVVKEAEGSLTIRTRRPRTAWLSLQRFGWASHRRRSARRRSPPFAGPDGAPRRDPQPVAGGSPPTIADAP